MNQGLLKTEGFEMFTAMFFPFLLDLIHLFHNETVLIGAWLLHLIQVSLNARWISFNALMQKNGGLSSGFILI